MCCLYFPCHFSSHTFECSSVLCIIILQWFTLRTCLGSENLQYFPVSRENVNSSWYSILLQSIQCRFFTVLIMKHYPSIGLNMGLDIDLCTHFPWTYNFSGFVVTHLLSWNAFLFCVSLAPVKVFTTLVKFCLTS